MDVSTGKYNNALFEAGIRIAPAKTKGMTSRFEEDKAGNTNGKARSDYVGLVKI